MFVLTPRALLSEVYIGAPDFCKLPVVTVILVIIDAPTVWSLKPPSSERIWTGHRPLQERGEPQDVAWMLTAIIPGAL